MQVIEENKALLKSKYDVAKTLGGAVNDSKAHINELRSAIEQRRMQRAAAALSGGDSLDDNDPEEARFKDQMEKVRGRAHG